MNIFESLENLNVSEECFNDIMDIVEEYINEVSKELHVKAAKSSLSARQKAFDKEVANFDKVRGEVPVEKMSPVQKYRSDRAAEKMEVAQDRLLHAEEVAAQEQPKVAANKRRKQLGKAVSRMGFSNK